MFFIWGIWLSFELHQAWSITLPCDLSWIVPISSFSFHGQVSHVPAFPTHPDICIAIRLPSKPHIYITYVLPVRSIYCCTLSDFTHFCVWNFGGSSCSPITLTFWKLDKIFSMWLILNSPICLKCSGICLFVFYYGPLINFVLYFLSLM